MIDWCDEEYNFLLTDINLSPAEEKWMEDEVVKKGFQKIHSNCFGYILHGIKNEKEKKWSMSL